MNVILILFPFILIVVSAVLYHEYRNLQCKFRSNVERFEEQEVESRDTLDDTSGEQPFYSVQNHMKNIKAHFLKAKSHNIHFVTNTNFVENNIEFENNVDGSVAT